MYRVLVSSADFEAILTSFSEVIQNGCLSSKGKVPNRNKTSSSIKPNKFHSLYVCFGGRKNPTDPALTAVTQDLVSGVILKSNWSIWTKTRADHTARANGLYARSSIWCHPQLWLVHLNQVTRWQHDRSRRVGHKHIRKAEEVNVKPKFFIGLSTAQLSYGPKSRRLLDKGFTQNS